MQALCASLPLCGLGSASTLALALAVVLALALALAPQVLLSSAAWPAVMCGRSGCAMRLLCSCRYATRALCACVPPLRGFASASALAPALALLLGPARYATRALCALVRAMRLLLCSWPFGLAWHGLVLARLTYLPYRTTPHGSSWLVRLLGLAF